MYNKIEKDLATYPVSIFLPIHPQVDLLIAVKSYNNNFKKITIYLILTKLNNKDILT